MNKIIIGNFIALFAASLSIIIGFIKNKKDILSIQTLQYLVYTISNIILGGFTGAITDLISIVRNILSYKEKLTKRIITLIIIISIILTLMFNNLGLIGLFPLFGNIIYILFINTTDEFKFKILILITMLFWLVYDITIKSYTSAVFDLVSIMACLISAFHMYTTNKKEKQQN